MATSRPFARNTGATINGTAQVGNIAAGTPNNGFAATGLKWYNGPDEEPGYIVCGENLTGTVAPDGTTANIQFWRASANTDTAFIDLVKVLIPGSYANTTAALNALTNGGYWTNFTVAAPTTFGYTFLTGSSYPLTSPGNATLKIDNPTSVDKYIWLRGNSTFNTSGTNAGSASSTGLTGSPISISNTITGMNQTFDGGSYILIPANTLNKQFTVVNSNAGSIQLVYTDINTPSKTNVPQN